MIKNRMLSIKAVLLGAIIGLNPVQLSAAESSMISQESLPSLAPMLENVMPSVVSIYVEGSQDSQQQIPPQFRQFFGDNSPLCAPGTPFSRSPLCQNGGGAAKQKFQSLGAGVIINAAKGYVVTNNHVVANADKITIQLNDGRKFDAKNIGKDARSDIAVIQINDAKNLVAIQMADSEQLRVGDFTVAIGNPFGLGETATSGIISALGRSGLNVENYENFIQTDAAINRGNSGGALVNLKGELIGINTAILAPDGGNIGIGFAIPSNMVKNLTNQMIEYGEVRRGELGVMGTELNAELAKALKVDARKGAFVSQVMPDSAAAKAGIKAGDVIVSLNGKTLNSFAAFRAQLASMPIGSKLELGIIRDGKSSTLNATLEKGHETQFASDSVKRLEGAEFSNAQGKNQGVKITSVAANSVAERLGLKKDDLITAINQQPINNVDELRKILNTQTALLILDIRRGDNQVRLVVQ